LKWGHAKLVPLFLYLITTLGRWRGGTATCNLQLSTRWT